MRGVTALATLAALCAALAVAQDAPKAPPKPAAAPAAGPLAGFGWFAELAGSCWTGTHADGRTSDTQCYLVQYGSLMRGSIKVSAAGAAQPLFEGDAVFALDPTGERKVRYAQWGTGGVYTTGELTFDGDALVFHSRQPDGNPGPFRNIWRRVDADRYRVTRERNVDSRWVEAFSVEYKRIPGK